MRYMQSWAPELFVSDHQRRKVGQNEHLANRHHELSFVLGVWELLTSLIASVR